MSDLVVIWIMPVLLICKFHEDWMKTKQAMLWTQMGLFGTQGQVTPKWIVWSGQNSNLVEILYMS